MRYRKILVDGFYLAGLPYDSEAVCEIKKLVEKEDFSSGFFNIIGAVKEATISFYDQSARKYVEREYGREMEILSCIGNVSLKDDRPLVHAHACFGLKDGSTVGGHLVSMKMFAGELHFFPGSERIQRIFDEKTGLHLLSLQEVE